MSEAKKERNKFVISMKRTGPMQFETTFDENFPHLFFDEPPEIGGEGAYPNASRILTAAIMNCISASLVFCMKKSRIEGDFKLETIGTCELGRNEENLLRITQISVELKPGFATVEDRKKFQRCSEIFKKHCVVSMSVQAGIPINTKITLED